MRYILLVFITIFSTFAYCDELLEESLANCDKSQLAMNICAFHFLEEADRALNSGYKKLFNSLTNKNNKARLRLAQHQWVKFRDANCSYEARGSTEGGGSMSPMAYDKCRERVTRERTIQIEKFNECTADDCPQ